MASPVFVRLGARRAGIPFLISTISVSFAVEKIVWNGRATVRAVAVLLAVSMGITALTA